MKLNNVNSKRKERGWFGQRLHISVFALSGFKRHGVLRVGNRKRNNNEKVNNQMYIHTGSLKAGY